MGVHRRTLDKYKLAIGALGELKAPSKEARKAWNTKKEGLVCNESSEGGGRRARGGKIAVASRVTLTSCHQMAQDVPYAN